MARRLASHLLLLLAAVYAPAVDDDPRTTCHAHDVIGHLLPQCWFSWCFHLSSCTTVSLEAAHIDDAGAVALAAAASSGQWRTLNLDGGYAQRDGHSLRVATTK